MISIKVIRGHNDGLDSRGTCSKNFANRLRAFDNEGLLDITGLLMLEEIADQLGS